MQFDEFAQKLMSAFGAGENTARFTKALFEAILNETGQEVLKEYKSGTVFKNYFNGHGSITGIARKINLYVEPMGFSAYINDMDDAIVEKLCKVFSDMFPEAEPGEIGDLLADLFEAIITEAAGQRKKQARKRDFSGVSIPPIILDPNGIAPDLGLYEDGVLYMQRVGQDMKDDPFRKYLDEAVNYYSTKKTLLYAEKPHPFDKLYVCNNIKYKRRRFTGAKDTKPEKLISDATVAMLEAESRYIIIEGIGGIGKSMFLTHLFLSSAKDYNGNNQIPLMLPLKDYKETTSGIIEFIWKCCNDYATGISQADIIEALQNKKMILLMDGMDEIQSSARESFDLDLEAFIKSYSGNTIIVTSRPTNSFIAYSKFSVFDIEPLTKTQAIELVENLEFWDIDAQKNFIKALDEQLFYTHYQFASNPLLLTIMLMTYSYFGEVPAKMHIFYSKAYETMARLHDATKGSFVRPLHTKLSPEDFSKYFAEFCARTYRDEVLEFTYKSFAEYMSKVIKKSLAGQQGITPRDFLLDLTDNLCIMFKEGENYYFIHRSFQEYFTALYFSSEYDAKLKNVGNFFEKMRHRSYTDRTFDMLCDMIPDKIERYIFLPFLEELLAKCKSDDEREEYWEFLEQMYPALYYEEGRTGESYSNEAQSFLYRTIVSQKQIEAVSDLDDYGWPDAIYDLPQRNWVEAYSLFLEADAYEEYPVPNMIKEEALENTTIICEDELPYRYEEYFGTPDVEGTTVEVEIYKLRKNPLKYQVIRKFMEQDEFPLMREYRDLKKYYEKLYLKAKSEGETDDLFDD